MIPLLLAALSAHAADRNVSPYAFEPVADVTALAVLTGVTLGGTRWIDTRLEPRCTTACALDRVPAFDRGVVGNGSDTARIASDYTNLALVALPFGLALGNHLATDPSDGWAGTATDLVVITQTVLTSTSVYMLTTIPTRRPRPIAYDPATPVEVLEAPDTHISFFSGHTATSFAMAVAASRTFAMRHPDSPAVGPLWAASLFAAAATGYLRSAAGRHFYSDVLAGAVIGIAIGFVVPEIHRARDRGPRLSIAPAPVNGGAGVVVTVR